jgi:hypothetical protein
MLDSVDILEVVAYCYERDYKPRPGTRVEISTCTSRAEEYAKMLYPVIFSEEFQYDVSQRWMSKVHNKTEYEKRRSLLDAAFKKVQTGAHLKTLTSFRPFNIREIEYDIWELGYIHEES